MNLLTNAGGGYMKGGVKLMKRFYSASQPMQHFRQFCDVTEAVGKNKGDLFGFNTYGNLAVTGNTLAENSAMPVNDIAILRGSVTLTESGEAIPYSGKLEAIAEHDIKNIVEDKLAKHAAQTLDRQAFNAFNSTQLVFSPAGGNSATDVVLSTTGSAGAQINDSALTKEHVNKIVNTMRERNVPTYDNENYICVAHPSTLSNLQIQLESVRQYVTEGYQVIANGEMGRYDGTRFIRQTNVPKESWTNGKSDFAFFFGADTVMEAVAVPEEIRAKIPTDFGRDNAIGWYYIGGFSLIRQDVANGTVFKWGSQS